MAKKPTTKTTSKKTTEKKVAKPKATKSIKSVKTAMTKSELLTTLADAAELNKKQVGTVMEHLAEVIHAHLGKGSAGSFTLPGLLKLQVVRKPAVKARKGVNPFTGEETMFKAKPARNVVKARVLKRLKDAVA